MMIMKSFADKPPDESCKVNRVGKGGSFFRTFCHTVMPLTAIQYCDVATTSSDVSKITLWLSVSRA